MAETNLEKLMHAPFCADILIGQVGAGGMVALLLGSFPFTSSGSTRYNFSSQEMYEQSLTEIPRMPGQMRKT